MLPAIFALVPHHGQTAPVASSLPYQKRLSEMAEGWRAKFRLPGVWCAFIKDGKVVACVASGIKNTDTGERANVDDHLNVGSVSKVITGTLIAELVAKSVLTYETTLEETFPELASKYPNSSLLKATLRQLLAHTSGLPRETAYWPDKYGGIAWRLGQTEVALRLKGLPPPGTAYSYGAGIPIATAMAERWVANRKLEGEVGASYEDWLTGALGRSIGLTNPQMLDYMKAIGTGDIQPHEFVEGVALPSMHRNNFRRVYETSGSCRLTLMDLCRFAIATLDNAPTLPATVYKGIFDQASVRLHSDTSASWHRASLGWLFHEGNTGRGEWAVMRIDPTARAAFVFYTNVNFESSMAIPKNSFGDAVQRDLNNLYRGEGVK